MMAWQTVMDPAPTLARATVTAEVGGVAEAVVTVAGGVDRSSAALPLLKAVTSLCHIHPRLPPWLTT